MRQRFRLQARAFVAPAEHFGLSFSLQVDKSGLDTHLVFALHDLEIVHLSPFLWCHLAKY